MARGLSLHIGLNAVDPTRYDGWDGALVACENDARSMMTIAQSCGFVPSILVTRDATSSAVVSAIGTAAQELASGEFFLLTYSGHGGQVTDVNGDEPDGLDETWVLFDRMLVDDELYALWSHFAVGVRIFVLSDSCHSGTVIKALVEVSGATAESVPRTKEIPRQVARNVEARDRDLYRTLQWIAGDSSSAEVGASVILISGCQDDQTSLDGTVNGRFTEKLLTVWQAGAYQGDYPEFCRRIVQLMPDTQTPNYFVAGADNAAFSASEPFSI